MAVGKSQYDTEESSVTEFICIFFCEFKTWFHFGLTPSQWFQPSFPESACASVSPVRFLLGVKGLISKGKQVVLRWIFNFQQVPKQEDLYDLCIIQVWPWSSFWSLSKVIVDEI